MAKRTDVISVNTLWDIFETERERAWAGVTAKPGTPEWEIAAGKIHTINNICKSVYAMNAAERSSSDNAVPPIWKSGTSVVHTDYANGLVDTKLKNWAAWTCPKCGDFVGEQFIPSFAKQRAAHNQHKCNFCSCCGQRIDWAKVEEMK